MVAGEQLPDIPAASAPIVVPGQNCWRTAEAERAAMLTNQDYFRALASSLAAATRQVIVLGWELDAKLVLDPRADGPGKQPLVDYLLHLLRENPDLEICFLLWDRTIFYGGNRKAKPLVKAARKHPRLHVRFASPGMLASLHHKLVAVDDCVAYVGGIDITGDRWDRRDHPPRHPRRVTPEGEHYGPIHDLQMAVDGEAARAMGDLARYWWNRCGGHEVRRVEIEPCPPWPDGIHTDFKDVRLAIARTDPLDRRQQVREIERLNRDCLMAARHCIYIETQYLTSAVVGDCLCAQLQRPDGPEIVVIVTLSLGGMLEKLVMYNGGNRLLRRLRAADRYGRLRVYHPTVGRQRGSVQIKVHAKLIVVDNHFLRIGSSNLNNRSMGLDVECDIALEASTKAQSDAIAAKRTALLAQQLGRKPGEVEEMLARTGSLIETVDRLNGDRKLEPMPALKDDGPSRPLPGTAIFDPDSPITPGYLWRRLWRGAPGACDL